MSKLTKKIVLIGAESVGKTSLIARFVHSIFSDEYLTTIGVKISKKEIRIGDLEVSLVIWDIAGDMMTTKVYRNYVRGAGGILFVHDLSRPETYSMIVEELEALKETGNNIPPYLLVGNKVDLIENEDMLESQSDFHSSAKTGGNVNEAFYELVKQSVS